MDLVILAAGMGSRFGGLKQIEKMDDYGNFIIDYSIYDAIEAGFDKVIFIIKEENLEIFRETVGKRIEDKIKVEYVFQKLSLLPEGYEIPSDRVKPLGTAQAILAAKDKVSSDFAIINADDFYGKETYEVAFNYLKSLPEGSKGKYAIVAFEAKNTMTENGAVKSGVAFKDEKGYLEKLIESSIYAKGNKVVCEPLDGTPAFETEPNQLVSMNLFCFNKDLIPALGEKFPLWLKENINVPKSEFLIPTVVDELVHENKATVRLLSTPSVWFGVTYKEDKPGVVKALKALVEKGEYKEGLY